MAVTNEVGRHNLRGSRRRRRGFITAGRLLPTNMASACDGCGRRIRVAGGVGDLWTFDGGPSEALTMELADGSEHLLCFGCVERLPDDREPTAEDVAALPPAGGRDDEDHGGGDDGGGVDAADDGDDDGIHDDS